ncbi:MAG: ABC transporter ATP-binding protein [Deltaproteobacteria bacterium]|jgi:oligopeptide/dipeptide ABC transporter ATP-binding protein|nr:ABC transporter ATP-binding protein [Deltaproteobacteria bacterium]
MTVDSYLKSALALKKYPPSAIEPKKDTEKSTLLLDIRNLSVAFGKGDYLPVKGVDLILAKGEVAGLVGESGSGKSLAAFSLMGLLPFGARVPNGEIIFKGLDLIKLAPKERRALCGKQMGMIFQEPLTALNPVLTIGEQVSEIFRYHEHMKKKEARELSYELLSQVGLPNPKAAYSSYPHRFSGGMRQRVVIAMALALNPDLVIADEPTTALDPTIALQITRLLHKLTKERNTGVLFITHNLRILSSLAYKVFVMYAGLILEETGQFLKDPLHPYTRALVDALPPNPSEKSTKALIPIPGQGPGPADKFKGCPFEPRCTMSFAPCTESLPPLFKVDERSVRCFRYGSC